MSNPGTVARRPRSDARCDARLLAGLLRNLVRRLAHQPKRLFLGLREFGSAFVVTQNSTMIPLGSVA